MSGVAQRPSSRSRSPKANQDGYALLMAIFLVATVIIFATAITPSILTEGRREREQEAIWRGNQYVRAIQLYYRKNGKYPQTVDDLIKGSLSLHYLRKAYTDPMNTSDGTWRFIYVSPSGQLIGSVKYHTLQEMALKLNMPGAGQSLANLPGQQGAAGQQNGQTPGQQGNGTTGTDGTAGTAAPGTNPLSGSPTDQQGNPGATQASGAQSAAQQGFGPTSGAFSSSFGASGASGPGGTSGQATGSGFGSGFGPPAISNVPLEPVDGPVLGAFLIGVAGKVKKPSLIVYQGGKSDFEWEFIYNPLSVTAVPGQPATGVPGAQQPGGASGTAAPTGFAPTAPGTGAGASGAPGSTSFGLPPIGGSQ